MADRYALSHDLSVDVFDDGSAQFVTWGKNIEIEKGEVAGAAAALLRAMLAREAKITTTTFGKKDVIIFSSNCSDADLERLKEDLWARLKGQLDGVLMLVAREPFSVKKLNPEQRRVLIEELQRAEVGHG